MNSHHRLYVPAVILALFYCLVAQSLFQTESNAPALESSSVSEKASGA